MKTPEFLNPGNSPKTADANRPLVSIVTPVFNGRQYLEQTVQSVLGQSYANIEYIIIDGGSTDGTLDIIKKYQDRIDFWASEPDQGMYDAVNKGLKRAAGEIVAYLNADDLYYSDTVKQAVEFLLAHPSTDLVYGDCDFIGPDGRFLYTYRYPGFNQSSFVAMSTSTIPQQSSFWRKSLHEKIGYFDVNLKMCGDFDFYAKAGQVARIEHIRRPLAQFRIHESSLTSQKSHLNPGEVEIIHKRYLKISGVRLLCRRILTHVKIKALNLPLMIRKFLMSCIRLGPAS